MQSESMISATVQYRNQLQIQKIQMQIQIKIKKLNPQTGVGDKYGDYWETPPPLPLLSRFLFSVMIIAIIMMIIIMVIIMIIMMTFMMFNCDNCDNDNLGEEFHDDWSGI